MPTPIPSNQIITAVKESVDLAFQQGIVGFLLICAFAFAVIAIVALIYVIRRPSKTVGEHDVNIAISSLADKAEERSKKAEERAQKKEDQLQKQNEKHSDEMKVMGEQFLEAMRQMATANTLLGGNQTIQITGIEKITTVVEKIDTVGSTPMQKLIIEVAEIKKTVNDILTNLLPCAELRTLSDEDRKLLLEMAELIKNDSQLLKSSMQARIEDKRKGDSQEMNTVIVPKQTMKVDTSNLLSGDEAATKPEAA